VELRQQIVGQVAEVTLPAKRATQATIREQDVARHCHALILLATILAGEVVAEGDGCAELKGKGISSAISLVQLTGRKEGSY
jgi:hypothetical protein